MIDLSKWSADTKIEPAPLGTLEGVAIDYTNWQGERATRNILPLDIRFGTTPWHHEPQWLLVAIDVDKDLTRIFALKDIHSWT
jgi:hypothetical protein